MESLPGSWFVGIDVAKGWLDVHVLPTGLAQRVTNEVAGHQQLIALLRANPVERVVMEASGGYEREVVAALLLAQLPVVVMNPRVVRDFAKALNRLAKTDTIDAETLARFGQQMCPEIRPLPTELEHQLQETLARRQQLLGLRTMEKNRLEQARATKVRASIQVVLRTIEAQLQDLDQELEGLIHASPAWREKYERYQSIPGVGEQTARCLVASLPELGHCSRQQIASLVGLAPMNRDSGTWRGKRLIVGGRAGVRKLLYMAAVTASRWNPVIHTLYHRLLKAGKAPKLALVACMRKLLVILNALERKHESWNPKTA